MVGVSSHPKHFHPQNSNAQACDSKVSVRGPLFEQKDHLRKNLEPPPRSRFRIVRFFNSWISVSNKSRAELQSDHLGKASGLWAVGGGVGGGVWGRVGGRCRANTRSSSRTTASRRGGRLSLFGRFLPRKCKKTTTRGSVWGGWVGVGQRFVSFFFFLCGGGWGVGVGFWTRIGLMLFATTAALVFYERIDALNGLFQNNINLGMKLDSSLSVS